MNAKRDEIPAGDLLEVILKVGKKPRHAQRIATDAVFSGAWSSDERRVSLLAETSSIEEVLLKWFQKWNIPADAISRAIHEGNVAPNTTLILSRIRARLSEKA